MELSKDDRKLHIMPSTNGVHIWEEGDKSVTAFISPSRDLKINDFKVFTAENLSKIKELQTKGNIIVSLSPVSAKIVLDPLNEPSKYYIAKDRNEKVKISVENIDGKEYAVSNKYVLPFSSSNYSNIENTTSASTDDSMYIKVDVSVKKDEFCNICKSNGYDIDIKDLEGIPTDAKGNMEYNYLKVDKNHNVDWTDEYEFKDSVTDDDLGKLKSLDSLKSNMNGQKEIFDIDKKNQPAPKVNIKHQDYANER